MHLYRKGNCKIMSLNLLIVDDEYFIRQRLKKVIPWKELNLSFAGEAENGQEALELIEKEAVDILLLDIKMPKISGIELAKYIHEQHRHIKIIILSGYNDFEYARSAIRYGVTDYLLKPIDQQSLQESLTNCIRRVNEQRKVEFKLRQLRERELTQVLYQYLNGHISYEETQKIYPDITSYPYAMLVGGFIYEEMPAAIIELITRLSTFGIKCHSFKETDFSNTLLLLFETAPNISSICTLLNNFAQECSTYVFLVYSPLLELHSHMEEEYKNVQYQLNARYFHMEPCVCPIPETSESTPLSEGTARIRQNLVRVLNSNETSQFHDFMDQIFDEIAERKQINYLTLILTEIFLTYNLHYEENIQFHHNMMDFINMILEEEYQLTNLEDTIISYGLQCMKNFVGSPSDISLSTKIISYIKEHYNEPELSVTEIAEFFQFNVSYLGSIFKKIEGCSILQYLTNVRLEAASQMLKNGAKIIDAANENGYSDVFYFSKRFKKKYGCSPKEFQLRCQAEEA